MIVNQYEIDLVNLEPTLGSEIKKTVTVKQIAY